MEQILEDLLSTFSQWYENYNRWMIGVESSAGQWLARQSVAVLQGYFPSINWTPWLSHLGQLNTVFPIGEFVGYGVSLFSAFIVVWTYRLAKSWAPTVSS